MDARAPILGKAKMTSLMVSVIFSLITVTSSRVFIKTISAGQVLIQEMMVP